MYKQRFCSVVLFCGISTLALASDLENSDENLMIDSGKEQGLYLGGQLAFSSLHYDGSSYVSGTSQSSYDNRRMLAGQLYLGYAFSQFLSAEFGYLYYGRPNFKDKNGSSQDLLQHGIDLVAKANMPLYHGFSFYAKAGAAIIYRGELRSNNQAFVSKGANNRLAPIGALGFSYELSPSLALDASWTKTMSVSDLPTTDLVGCGVIYKINL